MVAPMSTSMDFKEQLQFPIKRIAIRIIIHIKYRNTYRLWKKCIITPLQFIQDFGLGRVHCILSVFEDCQHFFYSLELTSFYFYKKYYHFSLLSPTSPCELSEREVTSLSNLIVRALHMFDLKQYKILYKDSFFLSFLSHLNILSIFIDNTQMYIHLQHTYIIYIHFNQIKKSAGSYSYPCWKEGSQKKKFESQIEYQRRT